ncbi:hypothetical protein [Nocardia alni]|nr:hypothetical protein [Nocardia alni]
MVDALSLRLVPDALRDLVELLLEFAARLGTAVSLRWTRGRRELP